MATVERNGLINKLSEFHEPARADISSSDLANIERLLSNIAENTRSLVSNNPGGDIRAVVNRLETANGHLSTIASNTRK
jgi:hypothetical protein